jgi:aminoglycoside phosphotransferase family enzyme/predicted kinase
MLPSRVFETHSALLFAVGQRVYKVKKPVSLGFLDFSTLDKRREVCQREVLLNRRLAPDVYLGVYDLLDTSGEPYEHMVVMRRMPEDRSLAALVRQGADVHDDLRRLARLIAAFHATATTSPEIEAAGSASMVAALWRAGLDGLRPFVRKGLHESAIQRMEQLSDRYLRGRRRLFRSRQQQGRIRDGHGDLLADDIYCLDDGPRVLDCIEFDDHLRFGDVLLDVAFLAMDLEDLGRPDLAQHFLSYYEEFSGQSQPLSLAGHYIAYRALVRSKVSFLRWTQGDESAREHAQTLAALALRRLEASAVRLILIGGLPGTGKSTIAARLADEHGLTLLRSDVLRKQLAGHRPEDRLGAPFSEGLYSTESRAQTYDEMLRRAQIALELGESVVLDASWSSERFRSAARAVATATCSDLYEIECHASAAVAAARMRARRAAGTDASDADPAIAERLAARFDDWSSAAELNSEQPVEDAVAIATELVCGAPADTVPAAREATEGSAAGTSGSTAGVRAAGP